MSPRIYSCPFCETQLRVGRILLGRNATVCKQKHFLLVSFMCRTAISVDILSLIAVEALSFPAHREHVVLHFMQLLQYTLCTTCGLCTWPVPLLSAPRGYSIICHSTMCHTTMSANALSTSELIVRSSQTVPRELRSESSSGPPSVQHGGESHGGSGGRAPPPPPRPLPDINLPPDLPDLAAPRLLLRLLRVKTCLGTEDSSSMTMAWRNLL